MIGQIFHETLRPHLFQARIIKAAVGTYLREVKTASGAKPSSGSGLINMPSLESITAAVLLRVQQEIGHLASGQQQQQQQQPPTQSTPDQLSSIVQVCEMV